MLPPGKDPDPVGSAVRHVVALGFACFAYAVAAALAVRIGEGGGGSGGSKEDGASSG